MRYTYYTLVLTLIFNISCTEVDNKEFETIVKISNAKDKKFDELVEDVFFVKLDNTNGGSLSYINNVQISKDYIFIGDVRQQEINVFSFPEGVFIRKINAQGGGPGEYLRIDEFQINVQEQYIQILDSDQKKIIKYNVQGEFISSKSISFSGAAEFVEFDNKESIVSGTLRNDKENEAYELFLLNEDLSLKSKQFYLNKDYGVLFKFSFQYLTYLDGKAYFNPLYSPNIYEIDEKGIKPKYFIDFGDNWMDEKYIGKYEDFSSFGKMIDDNDFVNCLNTVIGKKFMTIDYYKDKKYLSCLYNLKNKNLYNISDFENSICLKNGFSYYNNGYFISLKTPSDLIEFYKKNKSKYFKENFISSLKAEGNQILMFTKFKIVN